MGTAIYTLRYVVALGAIPRLV